MQIVIDPADPTKQLLPGDWVYFANIIEYGKMVARLSNMVDNVIQKIWRSLPKDADLEVPPEYGTNFWQGEHAIYVGNKKFTGLGFEKPVTYDEMMTTFLKKHEEVVQAYCQWKYRKYNDDASSESDCMATWKAEAAGQKPQLARVMRLDYSKLSELSK